MESDHTPEASTNIGAQGEDNLTQPSAGEQPTSVEDIAYGIIVQARLIEAKDARSHQLTSSNKLKEQAVRMINKVVEEERRQAKYEAVLLLQRRLCTGDAEHRALDDRIWHITENYKSELREGV